MIICDKKKNINTYLNLIFGSIITFSYYVLFYNHIYHVISVKNLLSFVCFFAACSVRSRELHVVLDVQWLIYFCFFILKKFSLILLNSLLNKYFLFFCFSKFSLVLVSSLSIKKVWAKRVCLSYSFISYVFEWHEIAAVVANLLHRNDTQSFLIIPYKSRKSPC